MFMTAFHLVHSIRLMLIYTQEVEGKKEEEQVGDKPLESGEDLMVAVTRIERVTRGL